MSAERHPVEVDQEAVEAELRRVGAELAAAFPSSMRHPLRTMDARAMDLAARDEELRAALFRFVDVVPACRSLDDVARHLTAFLEEVPDAPPPIAAAMKISHTRAGRTALGAAAAGGVKHMAHRFIVGETPAAALSVFRSLWGHGVGVTVDLLGEATVTSEEADRYAARCASALEELATDARRWPERAILERDSVGPLPRANVSVKVSALTPLLRPDAPDIGREDAARRLRPLLRDAARSSAPTSTSTWSRSTRARRCSTSYSTLLSEEEFRDGPSAGLVLQAYLRDSPEQLDHILEWARSCERTPPFQIRLVKGAYWDHELVQARQHGWPAPVYEVKADCDRNYEALTRTLVYARPFVRVAIASHNLRSVAHAIGRRAPRRRRRARHRVPGPPRPR